MAVVEKINSLISMLSISPPGTEPVGPYRRFSAGGQMLTAAGVEAYGRYDKCLNELYENPAIAETLSARKLEKPFQELLASAFRSGAPVTTGDVDGLFRQLLSLPIEEYITIRGIHGIVLGRNRSLELGAVTLYRYPDCREEIAALVHLQADQLWEYWRHSDFVAVTKVSCRDTEKAEELSVARFMQFEEIICMGLSPIDTSRDIILTSAIPQYFDMVLVCSPTGWTDAASLRGPFQPIDLSERFFTAPENGNEKLWSMAKRARPSIFESSIFRSIGWIASAKRQYSLAQKIVFLTIAIETLLSTDEGAIIRPGTTHYICEAAALLLGRTYEERVQIESRMRAVYGLRSAIVHGGKKAVTGENVAEAHVLATALVRKIVLDDDLANLSSTRDLAGILKKLKYS